MMSLVCKIIITITAIFIIYYDFKFQQIPIYLILINYCCLCLLINPFLLISSFLILLVNKLNKPIDIIYILLLLYIILYHKSIISAICILLLLFQVIFSKNKTIKFMISIELSILLITYFIL